MKLSRLVFIPIALVALLAVACTEQGDTIVQNSAGVSGISAAGVGRVTGKPDVVIMQLGVDVEMRSVEAARSQAASSMQAALDALKANGVEDKDIQTVQFTVSPQYDYTNSRQTLRGYRVTNVVSAKIRKVESAGKIIDDVSRAAGDAAVVRNLRFTIDDPSKLQAQARDLAVKQARERAEQLASPAGVKVGRVLSITEGTASTPQPFAAAIAIPRTGDVSTPIESGELEIVVNINAVFAIDD